MNIKDHKNLAQWLIANKETEAPISGIERVAFILGNMEPDMNPLTYFRGFFCHTRMRGHNYENALKKVRKLLAGIEKKAGAAKSRKRGRIGQFFLAGVLMHYVADAFTWPHNEAYGGSLKDHVIYEVNMHQIWKSGIVRVPCRAVWNANDMQEETAFVSAFEYFVRQHERYLVSRCRMQDDLEYILRVSAQMSRTLLGRKGKQYERNDYIRRDYDRFRRIPVICGAENEKGKACPVFSDRRAGIDAMPGSGRFVRIFISPKCYLFHRNFSIRHFRTHQ